MNSSASSLNYLLIFLFCHCKKKIELSGVFFSPTQSIGLLSYTFLTSTGKEDIVVPMVMSTRTLYCVFVMSILVVFIIAFGMGSAKTNIITIRFKPKQI